MGGVICWSQTLSEASMIGELSKIVIQTMDERKLSLMMEERVPEVVLISQK